jgi:hypothetical protein
LAAAAAAAAAAAGRLLADPSASLKELQRRRLLEGKALLDPSNILLKNWDTASYPCDGSGWTGVCQPCCTAEGLVTFLRIIDASLNGRLPTTWGIMPGLEELSELDLIDLSAQGPLPPGFGRLPKLQRLSLRSNQLTGGLPDAWRGLADLRWLDLYDNQLTSTLPPSFGDLTKLRRLILTNNPRLTGTIPCEWNRMGTQLDIVEPFRLYLGNTKITGCYPSDRLAAAGQNVIPPNNVAGVRGECVFAWAGGGVGGWGV